MGNDHTVLEKRREWDRFMTTQSKPEVYREHMQVVQRTHAGYTHRRLATLTHTLSDVIAQCMRNGGNISHCSDAASLPLIEKMRSLKAWKVGRPEEPRR